MDALSLTDHRLLLRWLEIKTRDRLDYHRDIVRIRERRIEGYSHLVASREGVFAIDRQRFTKVLDGLFYGLTIRGKYAYAFQAHDLMWSPTKRGRIVRLEIRRSEVVDVDVVLKGLDNGCHQIDFVGSDLLVLDTYNQAIRRYDADFRLAQVHRPLGEVRGRDFGSGYVHLNSIVARGGWVYLLLHNGGLKEGRRSEVVVTDRNLVPQERFTVPGTACHNVVVLEDGDLLICDSEGGSLINRRGTVCEVGEHWTRGLSVDGANVVVGDSLYSIRSRRTYVPGRIHFLDRSFRSITSYPLPAAPTEIRRLDGHDLSLSNYGVS